MTTLFFNVFLQWVVKIQFLRFLGILDANDKENLCAFKIFAKDAGDRLPAGLGLTPLAPSRFRADSL